MSKMDRFFNPVPTPGGPDPDFPYELVRVAGAQAVEVCQRLREEGRGVFTPVILGHLDEVRRVKENMGFSESTPESLLARAKTLVPEEVLRSRKEIEGIHCDREDEGEWPNELPGVPALTAHTSILTGEPKKVIFIAKVPTAKSYEVPAWLKLGDWNECPSADQHVVMHRYWHENYGANIISATGDIIECTVERPPGTREEAIALAREQFVYCPDIVDQGCGTVAQLAATLKDSGVWYFWWD
jgi:hypothetical protein